MSDANSICEPGDRFRIMATSNQASNRQKRASEKIIIVFCIAIISIPATNQTAILTGPCSNNDSRYIGKLEISKIKKPSCCVRLTRVFRLTIGKIKSFSHVHNVLTFT